MGELIHIRLDAKMRKAIQEILKTEHYASESEFVRDAVRKNLDTYARVAMLRKFQGTVPRRTLPYVPLPDSELFRAFGLPEPDEISNIARHDEGSVAPRTTRVRLVSSSSAVRR